MNNTSSIGGRLEPYGVTLGTILRNWLTYTKSLLACSIIALIGADTMTKRKGRTHIGTFICGTHAVLSRYILVLIILFRVTCRGDGEKNDQASDKIFHG